MTSPTPAPPSPEPSAIAYTLGRIRRHIEWARTEGLGRLIEEDRLDPRERVKTAWSKWRWRRLHGIRPGQARPAYVVGLQRSGTNMLLRGLDVAPYIDVHNENDRRLFQRFRLRPDDVLQRVVNTSRHQIVLIKPLCDSQHITRLLDLPGIRPGSAVWVVRDVGDRTRSEVSKFGDASLRALKAVRDGHAARTWQGERLPADAPEVLAAVDLDKISAESGAALLWYLRNSLYYELALDHRSDVLLFSYDAFVRDPEPAMQALCAHLDVPYHDSLIAHVERRSSHASAPLVIDPHVRELCNGLQRRLDATLAAQSAGGSKRAAGEP